MARWLPIVFLALVLLGVLGSAPQAKAMSPSVIGAGDSPSGVVTYTDAGENVSMTLDETLREIIRVRIGDWTAEFSPPMVVADDETFHFTMRGQLYPLGGYGWGVEGSVVDDSTISFTSRSFNAFERGQPITITLMPVDPATPTGASLVGELAGGRGVVSIRLNERGRVTSFDVRDLRVGACANIPEAVLTVGGSLQYPTPFESPPVIHVQHNPEGTSLSLLIVNRPSVIDARTLGVTLAGRVYSLVPEPTMCEIPPVDVLLRAESPIFPEPTPGPRPSTTSPPQPVAPPAATATPTPAVAALPASGGGASGMNALLPLVAVLAAAGAAATAVARRMAAS